MLSILSTKMIHPVLRRAVFWQYVLVYYVFDVSGLAKDSGVYIILTFI